MSRLSHIFHRCLQLVCAFASTLIVAWPAAAQSSSDRASDRLFASVGVGLFAPRRDLNTQTQARVGRGLLVGGGVGLELNDFSAVRVTFSRAKTEAKERTPSALNGTDVARRFIDVDLLIGRRRRYASMSYGLVGVSRVRTRQEASRDRLDVSSTAIKVGGGYEYRPARSPLAFFGEGAAYLHKLDRRGVDRRQFDVTGVAGVRIHF